MSAIPATSGHGEVLEHRVHGLEDRSDDHETRIRLVETSVVSGLTLMRVLVWEIPIVVGIGLALFAWWTKRTP